MSLETVALLGVAGLAVGFGVGWVVATARGKAASTDSAARAAALEATLQAESHARDTARRERDEARALLASREADVAKVREEVSRLAAEKAAVSTQAESLARRLAEEEARGRATLDRKAEVEASLRRVGAREVLFFERMDDPEGTGHIDMFAKLMDEHTVLVGRHADPRWSGTLDRNAQRFAALETYRRLGWKPVGIDVRSIIGANGAIHCISMQVPAR